MISEYWRKRIEDLEREVKELKERVCKLESKLTMDTVRELNKAVEKRGARFAITKAVK